MMNMNARELVFFRGFFSNRIKFNVGNFLVTGIVYAYNLVLIYLISPNLTQKDIVGGNQV